MSFIRAKREGVVNRPKVGVAGDLRNPDAHEFVRGFFADSLSLWFIPASGGLALPREVQLEIPFDNIPPSIDVMTYPSLFGVVEKLDVLYTTCLAEEEYTPQDYQCLRNLCFSRPFWWERAKEGAIFVLSQPRLKRNNGREEREDSFSVWVKNHRKTSTP